MSKAATATTLLNVAAMSSTGISIAYQLTRLLVCKAAEGAVSSAIALLSTTSSYNKETAGRIQCTLMELDIEAKFKSVRLLLHSIRTQEIDLGNNSQSFIDACIENVEEIMDEASATLLRVQEKMDTHAQKWMSNWRSIDAIEDLELLKSQCRMFDRRMDSLIQCLSVPYKDSNSKSHLMRDREAAASLKIGPDDVSAVSMSGTGGTGRLSRGRSERLAARAREDSLELHQRRNPDKVSTEVYCAKDNTRVIFADPVFL